MPLLDDLGSGPFHTGGLSRALLGCLCSKHRVLLGPTSRSYSRIKKEILKHTIIIIILKIRHE